MTSATQQHIHDKIEQLQQELASSWPELLEYLPTLPNSNSSTEPNLVVAGEPEDSTITQEDRLEVIEQLRALSVLPPAALEATAAAVLARKLGFVINTSVSFAVDDKQLLHSHGRVQVQQSSGYFNTLWPATKESTYALYVSPRQLDVQSLAQTPWFLGKRVLAINAAQMIGVVAYIAGVQISGLHRAQFSASSQLMRAGQFWQPGNQGQIIVCFLDDPLPAGNVLDLTQGGMQ
jgi:hypothetical protein